MTYRLLAAIAVALAVTPCHAEAQSELFRHAFACPDRGPSSVCVPGAIPKGSKVTVLAKGWKSAADPKEEFPNADYDFPDDSKAITRLETSGPPPKSVTMIAVFAGAQSIDERPLKEVTNRALADRIRMRIEDGKGLNLYPDIQLLKTRLLRLSPTILLSETFLARPDYVDDLRKQLPSGCAGCEVVPIWVGATLEDLFKPIRSPKINAVEHICGGIRTAFSRAGRIYVLSSAFSCESDAFSATLVHDLSDAQPKLIYKF